MGSIRVLDDHLINRIAAGEVVERPASVVKELVENSLDAGASSVHVRIEGGGKKKIRVADDGSGMNRDDALLALERHATSKLATPSDLDAIATLGFRGEALPSIAAVSRFRLTSAAVDGKGTEIDVRGGRIESVREVAAPRGTVIEVDRLFFNVPARRKFLRTDGTEAAHVIRTVTRHALVHPEVRWLLEHGSRTVIEAAPAASPADRVRQVLGAEAARRMVPFALDRAGVSVRGFAGRPADARPRRDGQHFFVNGRAVQDRVLAHAVVEAYGNNVPRGHHADLVVFVEVDPAAVDVNVHPQKAEVRFRTARDVHDAVRDAVRPVFASPESVPGYRDLRPNPQASESAGAAGAVLRHLELRERTPSPPRAGGASVGYRAPAGEDPHPAPPSQLHEEDGPEAVVLAQFRDSYIVAQDRQGLVLVDQHAAHERVLFERFLTQAEENRVEIQRLLFPVTVELAAHERAILEQEAEEFRRIGLLVAPFGGNTVRLDGIPALGAEVDPVGLLRELLGEASRVRSAAAGAEALRHRLVTTAACKAAIKIRHRLDRSSLQALVDDLYAAENPTTCPHGRPVLFRLTLDEIERAFRRR